LETFTLEAVLHLPTCGTHRWTSTASTDGQRGAYLAAVRFKNLRYQTAQGLTCERAKKSAK